MTVAGATEVTVTPLGPRSLTKGLSAACTPAPHTRDRAGWSIGCFTLDEVMAMIRPQPPADEQRCDLPQHVQRALELPHVGVRPALVLVLLEEVPHRHRRTGGVEDQDVDPARLPEHGREVL